MFTVVLILVVAFILPSLLWLIFAESGSAVIVALTAGFGIALCAPRFWRVFTQSFDVSSPIMQILGDWTVVYVYFAGALLAGLIVWAFRSGAVDAAVCAITDRKRNP